MGVLLSPAAPLHPACSVQFTAVRHQSRPMARCGHTLTTGWHVRAVWMAARPRGRRFAGAPQVQSRRTDAPLFMQFMHAPSVPRAVAALKYEGDPVHGWTMFRVVVGSPDMKPGTPFFQTMMTFCRKHLQTKAPAVLDVAASRGARICDALFGAFLGACLLAKPPLLHDALERYAKWGPRTHNVIYTLAHICRLSNEPRLALPLVSDAVENQVEFTEKLLLMLVGCCSEDRSAAGADAAERLLDLIQSKRIPSYRSRLLFSNLLSVILEHNRLHPASVVLSVMDSIGLPPLQEAYAAVLLSLAQDDRAHQALELFHTMVTRKINVDAVPLARLFTSLGHCRMLSSVKSLHAYARDKGLQVHRGVISALVDAYGHCRCVASVHALNDIARTRSYWNADDVIAAFASAYGHCCDLPSIKNLHELANGIGCLDHSVAVVSALARAYGQLSASSAVKSLHDNVRRIQSPHVVSLVAAYAACHDLESVQSLEQYARDRDVITDPEVLNELVSAYGRLSLLERVQELHELATGSDALSRQCAQTFIAAYSRCGRIDLAEHVFRDLSSKSLPACTSMIAAYAQAGKVQDAIVAFDTLKSLRLQPDRIVLLHLLEACRRAGDLERAGAIVDEFSKAWRIQLDPVHIACMVDSLANAGNLDDAELMARSLDNNGAIAWVTLLDACRVNKDVSRAERVFSIISASPDIGSCDLVASYRLMSAIYAAADRQLDADRVQAKMPSGSSAGSASSPAFPSSGTSYFDSILNSTAPWRP